MYKTIMIAITLFCLNSNIALAVAVAELQQQLLTAQEQVKQLEAEGEELTAKLATKEQQISDSRQKLEAVEAEIEKTQAQIE